MCIIAGMHACMHVGGPVRARVCVYVCMFVGAYVREGLGCDYGWILQFYRIFCGIFSSDALGKSLPLQRRCVGTHSKF